MGTIRILFASTLGLHSLLHLSGFVRDRYLVKAELLLGKTTIPLSEPETKAVGFFWLLTGLFFLTTAVGFLTGLARWWLIAFGAVLLSQLLILLYWQEAKAGTLINLIILIISLLAYADWNFTAITYTEIQALMIHADTEKPSVVTKQQVEALPPIVRKWLTRAQVIGKEQIQTVQLKQQGQMRTKANGSWMPVEALQYFTTDKPGFIWNARIKAAPLVYLAGRDKYELGHGNMLIKALSFWPIANASGKEVDQGTLLRYLAEMVWFPTAALNQYIHWEELNATSARATMNYGDTSASGVFTFTSEGDVIRFDARRYGEFEGAYRLETWSVAMKNHQELAGIRIPVEASVTWKLQTGAFTWYTLRITEIKYNAKRNFDSISSGSSPAYERMAAPYPK